MEWRALVWLNLYGREAVTHKLKNSRKTQKIHFLSAFELRSDCLDEMRHLKIIKLKRYCNLILFWNTCTFTFFSCFGYLNIQAIAIIEIEKISNQSSQNVIKFVSLSWLCFLHFLLPFSFIANMHLSLGRLITYYLGTISAYFPHDSDTGYFEWECCTII